MKTLTLHINDNIYEDVKKFLSIFSSDKLLIEEATLSDSTIKKINFSYEDFEKKWAGFIPQIQIDDNWKNERIDYLKNKHT